MIDTARWTDTWAWPLEHPAVRHMQQVALLHWWPQVGALEQDDTDMTWCVPDCFSVQPLDEDEASAEEVSTARSLQGRGVSKSKHKGCVVPNCPFRVEDDFCDKHGRGERELFMCDACHMGSHYECVA